MALLDLRDRYRDRELPPCSSRAAARQRRPPEVLKCCVALEGTTPKNVHAYAVLFDQLPQRAQEEIAGVLARTAKEARALFEKFDHASGRERTGRPIDEQRSQGTFVTWRYLHEFEEAAFYEPELAAAVRALHEVIVRHEPTWDFWPGVIRDP